MTQTAFPFDLGAAPEKDTGKKSGRKKSRKAAAQAAEQTPAETEAQAMEVSGADAQDAPASTKKKAASQKAKEKSKAKHAAEPPPQAAADLPDVQNLQLDQLLCFSLYSTTHAMQKVYKPLLKDLGLTYPQYLAMTVLWQKDKILVGDLGEQLHLESNTMTPLLKRLEGMGLLTRTRDKKDERQVRIALTRKGHSLKQKTKTLVSCILAATGFPVDELIDLQSRIMTLRDNLLKTAEEAG